MGCTPLWGRLNWGLPFLINFFPIFPKYSFPMVDNFSDKRFLFSTFFRIFVLLLPDREVDNTVLI